MTLATQQDQQTAAGSHIAEPPSVTGVPEPEFTFPIEHPQKDGDSGDIFVQKIVHRTYRVDADSVNEAIQKVLMDEEGSGVNKLSENITCNGDNESDWGDDEDNSVDD